MNKRLLAATDTQATDPNQTDRKKALGIINSERLRI